MENVQLQLKIKILQLQIKKNNCNYSCVYSSKHPFE